MRSICIRLIFIVVLLLGGTLLFADGEANPKEQPKGVTMEQIHRQLGPQLFNQSWDLLLKPDRTREEDNILINLVHASLYHWRQFGEPINILRGEWMICHVYTLLQHREEAYYHAMNIIRLREEIQPQDWDEAYALEAIARVHALLGNQKDFETFYDLAKKAGEAIAGEEDRKQFMSDFADGPWFGMISR